MKNNIKSILLLASLIGCCILLFHRCGSPKEASATEPHIVIYLGQAQSAEDYGFYNKNITTPFLDQCVEEGVLFEEGYIPDDDEKAALYGLLTSCHPNTLNNYSGQHNIADSPLATLKNQGYEFVTIGQKNNIQLVDKHITLHNQADITTALSQLNEAISSTKKPLFILADIPVKALPLSSDRYADIDSTMAYKTYLRGITGQDKLFSDIDNSIRTSNPKRAIITTYTQKRGLGVAKNLTMKTPIIFTGKGISTKNKRRLTLVSTLDILPTLLDIIDMEDTETYGKSLLPIIDGRREQAWPYLIGNIADGTYIRKSNFFYTQNDEDTARTIFELSYDPYCRDNMTEYHPRKIATFRKEIAEYLKQ